MTAPTFAGQPMHLDQHDLSAAPVGTVVRAADGTIAARYDATRGVVFGDDRPFPWRILKAPAVVLWPQGATKPTTGAECPQALRRACVSGEEYQRLAEQLERFRESYRMACRMLRDAEAERDRARDLAARLEADGARLRERIAALISDGEGGAS